MIVLNIKRLSSKKSEIFENFLKGKIKYFILGKYHEFLRFLGIELSTEWLLIRAIHWKCGEEKAKELLAVSILLELRYGNKNNKQTIKAIVNGTSTDKDTL